MRDLISAELLKSRKAKVVWITWGAFTLLPLFAGFFMFVLKHPDIAQDAGLLGAKAQLAGSADWPSFLDMIAQGIAIGGLFVFGFIASWVFGREYSDRTVKDLLALPFPRICVPAAKFATVLILSSLVTVWVIGVSLAVGHLIGLPQWSAEVWRHGAAVMVAAAVLTMLLSAPVALVASIGRGYLAPLGFVIMTMILSQIVAAVGYGHYFPWAIPALFSNMGGEEYGLNAASLMIVPGTGLTGLVGTLWFWRFADQQE